MIQIALVILSSLNVWAIDPDACKSASSELQIQKCLNEFQSSMKNFGDSPQSCNLIEDSSNKGNPCPPLPEAFADKAGDRCDEFISDKGGYGKWGKDIVSYLNEKGEDSIFFQDNLAGMKDGIKACPNWNNMSVDEKKHFWVWTMASIATIESSCQSKARGSVNPNGISVGLLQLDERASFRKWRGPNCVGKTITDEKDNLRCGLDIMEELLKGKEGEYKSSGQLWGPHSSSYWNHLRKKDGGNISDLIVLNPFCKK